MIYVEEFGRMIIKLLGVSSGQRFFLQDNSPLYCVCYIHGENRLMEPIGSLTLPLPSQVHNP